MYHFQATEATIKVRDVSDQTVNGTVCIQENLDLIKISIVDYEENEKYTCKRSRANFPSKDHYFIASC